MSLEIADKKRFFIFSIIEIALILAFAFLPVFLSFPYRVNIFLSWEGAYRLSQGQVPYKDFGMPLGYMYWVIPAFFFKIFGTQMITLVKAQVFINIISGLAFRSIMKSFRINRGIRLLSVFLYCISFSFFNFWPWYNHTVIVYEMIGLSFLIKSFFRAGSSARRTVWVILSGVFIFFSFFTKQDGGSLAILLCLALLACDCYLEKNWKPMLLFAGSLVLTGFIIMWPFTRYNFGYWFNHGQPPHTSRLSLTEVLDEFFAGSQWIKFYLFLMLLITIASFGKLKEAFTKKRVLIFTVLTMGILAEAAILQVTSYTPPDNNIFFHSFAFAYVLTFLSGYLSLNFDKIKLLLTGAAGLLLWWSGVYWKYIERFLPAPSEKIAGGENVVNRRTYMINHDSTEIPMSEWRYTGLRSFNKIFMPVPTVEGIHRLLHMDVIKKNKNLKVLNMTELTPLAVEIPYKEETGPFVPLWYHLGVAMFNREAEMYEQWIRQKKYDLILFEYVPNLNNFYPFRIRDTLQKEYFKTDSFPAPRRGDTKGIIEVYIRPGH